jgi:mxaD protein
MNARLAAFTLSLVAPFAALAAAPGPLKVTETIEIRAPADKVWAAVKDYDSLHKWHPGFADDKIVKGKNNEPGAVRSLTIKDGPTFTEELLSFDAGKKTYKYRIIESPLPLRDYVSSISLTESGKGTTVVTWVGDFRRKSLSETPPTGEDDKAAVDLITGVYKGGLANLKKQVEGG